MPDASSLRVTKSLGKTALTLVKRLLLLDKKLTIQQEEDHLYIPLIREPSAAELNVLQNSLSNMEITKHGFPIRMERKQGLINLLRNSLPPNVLSNLPHSVDFIGDIAVVEICPEMESYKRVIGEIVLKAHKNVNTVLTKKGTVSGTYRLRPFEVIAGIVKTETIHREHGCVFHVDLAKAYFSPRLSYEHSRVASLIKAGETVIDMFAGVGPFSILIAKKLKTAHIHSIDINPDAIELLKRNILANRVEEKVDAILGDARQIISQKLFKIADHVIMNLPEKSIEYVDAACAALKPEGGIIHYYEFSSTPEPVQTTKVRLAEAAKHANKRIMNISFTRIVRGVAPFNYQIAVDVEIR